MYIYVLYNDNGCVLDYGQGQYLSPSAGIKHVVMASLIRIGFNDGLSTRSTSYPHLLIFMISPISAVSTEVNTYSQTQS